MLFTLLFYPSMMLLYKLMQITKTFVVFTFLKLEFDDLTVKNLKYWSLKNRPVLTLCTEFHGVTGSHYEKCSQKLYLNLITFKINCFKIGTRRHPYFSNFLKLIRKVHIFQYIRKLYSTVKKFVLKLSNLYVYCCL